MTDVAIVGTGGIAGVHAKDLEALSGRVSVVAAVDPDRTALDTFCRQWNIGRRYADLADLLSDGGVDMVHLCTPPTVHERQAIACLEAGITVLCEKPPACSLAEFDRIAAAERDSPAWFATVFQHRFGGRARRLAGLGELMTAVCNTLWYRPDDYFAVPWRGRWETEGGGPTMGHGIHQIDLMLAVIENTTGAVWQQVTASAVRRARPTDTEDLSAALVTFDSGAVAAVVNSLLSRRETSYLRFDYEQATVELEHLYGYGDDDWRFTATTPGAADAWAATGGGGPSGHCAQFARVLDALDNGRPPPVTSQQARATLELVAAIYASAFTGRTVKAGEVDESSPFYRSMAGTGPPWPPAKR